MGIIEIIKEELLFEKKKKKAKRDACYHKVKSRYDVSDLWDTIKH